MEQIKFKEDFFSTIKLAVKDIPVDHVEKVLCAIADTFSGDRIYISKLYNRQRSVRNNSIKADFKQGFTVERLATKYLLSERHIKRLIM